MAIDFPDSPTVDQQYSVGDRTWTWNGTYWQLSQTSSTFTASDTAPINPSAGDIWFESDTGQTFIYYDQSWVEIGAATDLSDILSDADADTSIQVEASSDEDVIRFKTAGVERINVDASGNVAVDTDTLYVDSTNNRVGIGTTSPNVAFHVNGKAGVNIPMHVTSTDSVSGIALSDGDSTSASEVIIAAIGDDMRLTAGGSARMLIDSSGNVGINDLTPSYKLDVNGDINSQTDVLVSGTSLPRGRLIHWSTTSDFTLSTTASTYGNATFTLTESRHILAVLWYGELDSFSTNPINVYGFIYEPSTSDQIITALVSYTGSGGVSSLSESRHLILPAGTYTWEFQGSTNTGTCRVDNASSVNRSTGYAVFDMGGA